MSATKGAWATDAHGISLSLGRNIFITNLKEVFGFELIQSRVRKVLSRSVDLLSDD